MFFSDAAGRAGLVLLSLLIVTSNLPAGTQGSATPEADKAWKILEGAAASSDPANRMQAIAALGNSNAQVVPLLAPLLNDSKKPVRYMAAASIVRLSLR
jgi:HEAT repeat protein